MKRNYKSIVCFLRDSGRCKYASWKPFDQTCFCEKIDECVQKENEVLDKILEEVRSDPRSPWYYPYSRIEYRNNQNQNLYVSRKQIKHDSIIKNDKE